MTATAEDTDAGPDPLAIVRLLAEDVGPRRPTSVAEAEAAARIAALLEGVGVATARESFLGFSSFAEPLGVLSLLGLAPAAVPRRRRWARPGLAAAAALLAFSEAGYGRAPLTRALARRQSQNLVAAIDPAGPPKRTVCLVCHLDTSRSGLLFDPRLIEWLRPWLRLNAAAIAAQGAEALLSRSRPGRLLACVARSILALNLALLTEREWRGEDVAGANDNASGCAVVAALGAELAARPLETSRVVLLMTGCEESGTLGAQAFLRSRDVGSWLFLNFDNVGGPATLRYLRREGVVSMWDADPGLVALAEGVAESRPGLGLASSDGEVGLTYDATPLLANGARALTFAAHNGVIPNYHQPTDTVENVDPEALARALEVGREMLAAIDRGEADRDRAPANLNR